MIPQELTVWEQFIYILTLPDNIPIIGMLFLIFFFTYIGLREGRKYDKMMAEGRHDEIVRDMQR